MKRFSGWQFAVALFLLITSSTTVEGQARDALQQCLTGRHAPPQLPWQQVAEACETALTRGAASGRQAYAAHMEFGEAVRRLKNIDRSITLFDKAHTLAATAEERAAALAERGRSYDIQKDFMAAMADLDAALELDPNSFRAFYQRGLTHIHLGKLEQARDDLGQSFRLNPKYYRAKHRIGVSYALEGKHRYAVAVFDEILAAAPNRVWTYNARGHSYAMLGHDQQAYSDFTRVLNWQPKNRQALVRRAKLQMRMGLYDGGEADFAAANQVRQLGVDSQIARVRARVYAADYAQARDLAAPLFQSRALISAEARLWHYLASRLERKPHARTVNVLKPLKRRKDWLAEVGRVFLQEYNIEDLVARLHDQPLTTEERHERLSVAQMFEGYRLIADGNLRQAQSFFEQSLAQAKPLSLAKEASEAALRRVAGG